MSKTTIAGLTALGILLSGAAVAAEDGKALYEQKCSICHGKDGVAKPSGKGSKNFNDPAFKAVTVDQISKMIVDGKGKMPAYKTKLNEGQIAAIAAYIKTLAP